MQVLLFRKVTASRDKFLNVKLRTHIGPVMALNPMLVDWYDPQKEGVSLYKTLLLDPIHRAEVAKMIEERSQERIHRITICRACLAIARSSLTTHS